jgi:CPA1 family monovalent cation:H+ antiporter
MNGTEIFLIMLLAVSVVAYLAQRVNMAQPIAFVLAGMALAMLPDFPKFEIAPEIILLIFLPPLLSEAAYFTSLRDFRQNQRPILQMAIGLVVVSCVGVAYTLHWLMPEVSLAVCFVLGAIISPPDAVAAIAVTKKVAVPKRITVLLEGESLINDATGLVLYKFAVAAVVTGGFSLMDASLHFVWMCVSGIAIGIAIGLLVVHIFPRIQEMSVEILSTFLAPYAAYLLAEEVHGSGVLAVVAAGIIMSWHAPKLFPSAFRIPAQAVWRMTTFVLNGIVFLMIGLYAPAILRSLSTTYDLGEILILSLVVPLVAILIRFAWIYALAYGTRYLFASIRARDPYPTWQNVFVIAWTGMRGVMSLATALALPLTLSDGWTSFPHRDLIIFLAFDVILFTLVLQGLSLPWIIKKLSLTYDLNALQEQWTARKEATEAALARLDDMRGDHTIQSAALERIISHYRDRIESLGDGPNTPLNPNEPPTSENHPIIQTENRIWRDVLDAERQVVVRMRQTFAISDDVMHEILSDIDLLHNRFANST